ncbi:MAG TPA: M28 family peptidase [Falsiroseomonas sp.]|jgi:hypothetical protein|nr:M28 family peptidase [Falsiroseomonas sp.]
MPEQDILAAISTDRIRRDVERITTDIPSRLAGSPNGRRMAEYSRDALVAAGVAARVEEFPGLVSFPGTAELQVLAPREIAISANTLGHSVATLPEGLVGELIDVGSGAAAAYEGQDPIGKITLSELSYHPARHEKQRIAAALGAAGCVMMNWGFPGDTAVPFGSVKPAWGNPTPETMRTEMPTLPCIGISRAAGLALREMLGKGPVRLRVRANVDNGWRPVQITLGEIPAPTGDDFVVVGGHQDSWPGPQATDNAAGSAVILELARVFQRHRDQLRRGLVFGFWTGHETGTMVGSTHYVDREWDRLRRHAVAYLQIDQPGITGTTVWDSRSNPELRRFHEDAERRLAEGYHPVWRRAVRTGDSSFFGLGVPMVQGQGTFTEAELKASAMATLGWWHHSVENTLDKLDWGRMAVHVRVYAAWLWELCTAQILPFEFVTVADEFVQRLEQLAPAGEAIGLAAVRQQAEAFKAAAQRLDATAETWRRRYADGHADGAAAEAINACLKRLSRALVPLASTMKGAYGHDPYGYTPQGSMIPGLHDLPRLAGLGEGEERWLLETQLVRERNRVIDGLADAEAEVERTLQLLG